jgi:hypothetical protein
LTHVYPKLYIKHPPPEKQHKATLWKNISLLERMVKKHHTKVFDRTVYTNVGFGNLGKNERTSFIANYFRSYDDGNHCLILCRNRHTCYKCISSQKITTTFPLIKKISCNLSIYNKLWKVWEFVIIKMTTFANVSNFLHLSPKPLLSSLVAPNYLCPIPDAN